MTADLYFRDARLVDPVSPSPVVVNFFRTVAGRNDLLTQQASKWAQAAPIAEQFVELRSENLPADQRRDLWRRFTDDARDAGLYEGGRWATHDF